MKPKVKQDRDRADQEEVHINGGQNARNKKF